MARTGPDDGFSWRGQARVVRALIIREIYTRFGRDNIGFAWIVVEPVLFALGVILLWTLAFDKKGHFEVPVVEFLLTGYMPLLMYRHSVMRLLRCMQANGELLYHRQVTVLALYAARLAVEMLGALAAFVITVALFVIWGLAAPPHDIGLILGGLGLYMLFTAGIAILVGALSERSEVVEKIWSPLSYISVPLSGTFYMLYWLPPSARDVLVFIPMTSGVEMIRGGYFGPEVPVFYDWRFGTAFSLALLALALHVLRGARRHIELT